jgi:hypothetical protein
VKPPLSMQSEQADLRDETSELDEEHRHPALPRAARPRIGAVAEPSGAAIVDTVAA